MSIQTTRQSTGIVVAMAFCMALQMTGFVMILPLFARRFESFGAGVEALGMSALAYALTSAISAPFMGMLADRFGRRPIILLSLAAYVLAFSGYLFAASAWLFILLRGLAGGVMPVFVLRLSMGEFGEEIFLASRRVRPAKLLAAGYQFRFPDLADALRHEKDCLNAASVSNVIEKSSAIRT